MPAQSAAAVHAAFERRARRLESLTAEGLKLRSQPKSPMTVGSLDALFESALLSLYTAFETFLEDLFFSVLLGQSGVPGTAGLVTFSDRQQADMVLRGGRRDYLTWLPWADGVRGLAERLLMDGHPFNRLDRHDDELDVLEEMRLLRNAIAHEGSSAQNKITHLTGPMRARRRHPAGVLQDVQQGTLRLSVYSDEVRKIAAALTMTDDVSARNSLSPEKPYSAGAKPGLGTYECTRCRSHHVMRRKSDPLPNCQTCRRAHTKGFRGWRRMYL